MFDITGITTPISIFNSVGNAQKYGYEWEKPEDKNARLRRIDWLKNEIKRRINNMQIGTFRSPEERKIAEDIITKFNKELNTLEQMK